MAELSASHESVLGSDLVIKGTVAFEKGVRLHGRLEGNAAGSGSFHVATDGKLVGNVEAAAVIVEGDVRGDITATDRVELKASSHYEGDLRAARLAIEAGAFFTGHVTVGAEPGKDRAGAKPAAARPAGANAGKVPEPVGR
ncbi:MAG: polymer-forming cytoskeletal protein [Tepidisphaerales bacterium]